MYRERGYVLKKKILLERPWECENCYENTWQGQPIPLEVHHKDKNKHNNNLNNLKLLCPNCHSMTETFSFKQKVTDEEFLDALEKSETIHQALIKLKISTSGTQYNRARKIISNYNITKFNKKDIIENFCIDCGKIIMLSSIRCPGCSYKNRYRDSLINNINRDFLKDQIRNFSFVEIGKNFNVSDNAIKKWCKKFNLPSTRKEIKLYSDDEWVLI